MASVPKKLQIVRTEWSSVAPTDPSKVVHLKGSGRGMKSGEFPQPLVDELCSDNVEVVVWDGDSYSRDGFTQLLFVAMAHAKRVVAFIYSGSRTRFVTSWTAAPTPISLGNNLTPIIYFVEVQNSQTRHLQTQDERSKWIALGSFALETTCAKKVLLWGGGQVAAAEREAHQDVDWSIYK